MPLAKAEIRTLKVKPNSVLLQLDTKEQSDLSKFIKQCRVDKKKLKITSDAYDKCNTTQGVTYSWYQKPMGITALVLGGLAAGFALGGR